MTHLKDCPFCGGCNIAGHTKEFESHYRSYRRCVDCDYELSDMAQRRGDAEHKADKKWNLRADLIKPEPVADLEAIKADKPFTKTKGCDCHDCGVWDACIDHLARAGHLRPAVPREDRIAKLETALKALVNDAENYVNASEEYISDSNFDESGWLAESHANLKVVSMPKARKALEE